MCKEGGHAKIFPNNDTLVGGEGNQRTFFRLPKMCCVSVLFHFNTSPKNRVIQVHSLGIPVEGLAMITE